MVLGVTTSAWAISRLLGPSATRSATRRSPRGERLDAAQGDAAAPRAGGQQLGLGAGGQRRGAAARCQLQRLPQLLARLRAVVGAAQRRSQLGACLGVFELRRRVREHVDRSVEQLQPVLAARDEPCCAQGRAQRPWRPRCGRARVLRPPDGVPGSCSPSCRRARAACERQARKAGLRPPTDSKRRPAASSSSTPPARSPLRMRRRARFSRTKSNAALSVVGSDPARASAAAASSSLPCSISASARNAANASRQSASALAGSPRHTKVCARKPFAPARV